MQDATQAKRVADVVGEGERSVCYSRKESSPIAGILYLVGGAALFSIAIALDFTMGQTILMAAVGIGLLVTGLSNLLSSAFSYYVVTDDNLYIVDAKPWGQLKYICIPLRSIRKVTQVNQTQYGSIVGCQIKLATIQGDVTLRPEKARGENLANTLHVLSKMR